MQTQTIRPELAPDQKEALAIARRRQMEEERKARIFNAKERTAGVCDAVIVPSETLQVDRAALEEQIALKKAVAEREKQRDAMYGVWI